MTRGNRVGLSLVALGLSSVLLLSPIAQPSVALQGTVEATPGEAQTVPSFIKLANGKSITDYRWLGDRIAAAVDGAVQVYDQQGTLITTIGVPGSTTYSSMAWSPDQKSLAVFDMSSVSIWSIEGGSVLPSTAPVNQAIALAWSPDGEWLAVGGLDGKISLINISGEPPVTASANDSPRGAQWVLSWSPDSQLLASGSFDKTGEPRQQLRLWNRDGSIAATLEPGIRSVMNISWSPDGNMLAVAYAYNGAAVYKVSGEKVFQITSGERDYVYKVSWSPDGSAVAFGRNTGELLVYSVDGEQLHSVMAHALAIGYVSWSPDGKRIASRGQDQVVHVWDAATGDKVLTLPADDSPYNPVLWSEDSKFLLSMVKGENGDRILGYWQIGE